jgi:hypothetical protein
MRRFPLSEFGQLVLQQRAQEASGRPAFLVRALGELRPEPTDCGQPQFGQQGVVCRVGGSGCRFPFNLSSMRCGLAERQRLPSQATRQLEFGDADILQEVTGWKDQSKSLPIEGTKHASRVGAVRLK